MSNTAVLTMPSTYVAIEQEEMMYVDGGWSGEVFKNNMVGLYQSSKVASTALRIAGITLGTIYGMAKMTAAYIVTSYSVAFGSAFAKIGGIVGGLIAVAGVALAVSYLGNNRVFY